jgi:hypothetical protein
MMFGSYSQGASATAFLSNLSMSLRFLHLVFFEILDWQMNGIFERCSLFVDCLEQSKKSNSNLNPALEKLLPTPEL